jgi:hypothetical protein
MLKLSDANLVSDHHQETRSSFAPRHRSTSKSASAKSGANIDIVLRADFGRRFYGDGPPTWKQGKKGRAPKTSGAGAHERALLVKALRRDGSDDALLLAQKLDRCCPRRRCLSGACPECMRAAQRLFVEAAQNAVQQSGEDFSMVTAVCSCAIIPDADLCDADVFGVTRGRLAQALQESGVCAIGAFDLSFNEDERGDFPPHWSPHACFFVPRADVKRAKKALGGLFPCSREVAKPVLTEAFDGNPRGLAYALKPDFFRRVSLPPKTMRNGEPSWFTTREKKITRWRRVALAVALDAEGLDARLFLDGYALKASSQGRVEFAPQS